MILFQRFSRVAVVLVMVLVCPGAALFAQSDAPPKVLLVTAHPDDDALFAGTVYQITHALGGIVDLALVTDGAGGFRYATLGEPIYGLRLTDEAIGRQYLPAIRKRELMAGGEIVGIRNYFFLDQEDHRYTLNADSVLRHVWDAPYVRERLNGLLEREAYDFVFTMLPRADIHGHHKAATLLLLDVVQTLDPATRPIVLGAWIREADEAPDPFRGLEGYPLSRTQPETPPYLFDRTRKFGFRDRLDFKIVVNWVIAEHKSQGTMQLLMNRGDVEIYYDYELNDPARRDEARRLFEALSTAIPE